MRWRVGVGGLGECGGTCRIRSTGSCMYVDCTSLTDREHTPCVRTVSLYCMYVCVATHSALNFRCPQSSIIPPRNVVK